jgi:hypothetical protein
MELAQEAKRRGLWVHWGRVNTRRRFDLIVAGGAADSFDGSKWARFRKTYLPGGLGWLDEALANRVAAIAAVRDADRELADVARTDHTLAAARRLNAPRTLRAMRAVAGRAFCRLELATA